MIIVSSIPSAIQPVLVIKPIKKPKIVATTP